MPETSVKKRSAGSHARDDHALRVESAVVTGFVVHRLLRQVYPPKSSVQAPERPTFTMMGVVMGKSYAGKTHCARWVEAVLDVRHIVMHDLMKRSLETLEREKRLELQAAGSGVMETLRTADILGPDQSAAEMERREFEQLAQQQYQEDGIERRLSHESGGRPLGYGMQTGPAPTGAQRGDNVERKSDINRETGSKAKLEDRKSKEDSKDFVPKSSDGAKGSEKSKKSSKSASNNARSEKFQGQPDGVEDHIANIASSAEPAKPQSDMKQESSPSTKDIPSMKQDKARTAAEGGDVSDESIDSTSEDTMPFEYSRLAKLGREVKYTLEHGEEVRDQTLAGLLLEAWRELPDGSGWIIEGFPNTLAQAELLEEQLVGKQYDSDEELDEVEIVVTPLPKPEPPEDTSKDKGKKAKKEKTGAKKGKKHVPHPAEEAHPSPPPPPPEPVRMKVKPFRRSRLVPDANRRARPPPTSGLDLVVELSVSDEVAQRRRCQSIDRVAEQPDSGACQSGSDDHVTLAGKLFSYGHLREPLVEFYSERSVYHLVEADDLAAVETQLEKLIGASRARKQEEHRLAERRAAQLAAAENEPDSEPEEGPEEDMEHPDSGRGRGKVKSPKRGKNHSAGAKGKTGKGKGKGVTEPTQATEDLPQIPAPPPMPAPGETGYYFVDAPVPEGVAQASMQNL